MISHRLRSAYYGLMGIPMRINGAVYRRLRAPITLIIEAEKPEAAGLTE